MFRFNRIIKSIGILSLSLLLSTYLTSCGGSKNTSNSKSKVKSGSGMGNQKQKNKHVWGK